MSARRGGRKLHAANMQLVDISWRWRGRWNKFADEAPPRVRLVCKRRYSNEWDICPQCQSALFTIHPKKTQNKP